MLRGPRQLERLGLVLGTMLVLSATPSFALAHLGSCSSEASLLDLPASSADSVAEAWLSQSEWSDSSVLDEELEALGEGMTCEDGISCVILMMRYRTPRPSPIEGPVCRPGDPHCEMTPGVPWSADSQGSTAQPLPASASQWVFRYPSVRTPEQRRRAVWQLLRSALLVVELERPPRRGHLTLSEQH